MVHSTRNERSKAIKTILKVLGATISILALGVICCGSLIWYVSSGMCGNEIYQEIYSPDDEYKVVVFQRDCGATTGFSTQLSILNASDKLPNKSGNVFVIDGHPDWTNVQVKWDTDRAILITYSERFEVFLQKNKFRRFFETIKIEYQIVSEE